MENIQQENSVFDIQMDEPVKNQLKSLATWAGLAAIVSLVKGILGVIEFFATQNRVSSPYSEYGGTELRQQSLVSGFLMLALSLAITIILFFFLNKFSRLSKSGLTLNDPYLVTEGSRNLATYFKVVGILAIIMIVIAILFFSILSTRL